VVWNGSPPCSTSILSRNHAQQTSPADRGNLILVSWWRHPSLTSQHWCDPVMMTSQLTGDLALTGHNTDLYSGLYVLCTVCISPLPHIEGQTCYTSVAQSFVYWSLPTQAWCLPQGPEPSFSVSIQWGNGKGTLHAKLLMTMTNIGVGLSCIIKINLEFRINNRMRRKNGLSPGVMVSTLSLPPFPPFTPPIPYSHAEIVVDALRSTWIRWEHMLLSILIAYKPATDVVRKWYQLRDLDTALIYLI
jgi:hypothetical protein